MNYLTTKVATNGRIEPAAPIANARCHYGLEVGKEYALIPKALPYGTRLVTMQDMATLDKQKANDSLYYLSHKTGEWKRPSKKSDWQVDNTYAILKNYVEGPTIDVKVTIDGRSASLKDLSDAQLRDLRRNG